jgi:hypothetical protein
LSNHAIRDAQAAHGHELEAVRAQFDERGELRYDRRDELR